MTRKTAWRSNNERAITEIENAPPVRLAGRELNSRRLEYEPITAGKGAERWQGYQKSRCAVCVPRSTRSAKSVFMIHMIAERGESKSSGVPVASARCLIYGRNPAAKRSAASTPCRMADRTKIDPVWGLNGVKSRRQIVILAPQAHQNSLAQVHEGTDAPWSTTQSK